MTSRIAGVIRGIGLILGAIVAFVLTFQTFASPVLVHGGSRIVTVYEPPLISTLVALALYALALFAQFLGRLTGTVRTTLVAVALVVMLLATNRITQDAVRGEITDDWIFLPVQRLTYDIADGPMPVLTFSTWTVTVTSGQEKIIVFRGIPPIRLAKEPIH